MPTPVTTEASPPTTAERGWLDYIALSCDAGRRWVRDYLHPAREELVDLAVAAVRDLRQQRIEEGRRHLERLAPSVAALEAGTDPDREVMQRWYYGALSNYRYAVGDHDAAEHLLERAHRAVAEAISRYRFLLPLADHCEEFRLHRARIARNRHRWSEMREHVERSRRMARGEEPYCSLSDGSPVFVSTLADFYRAIPGLDVRSEPGLRPFFDASERMRLFDLFVQRMYVLPGFVIDV